MHYVSSRRRSRAAVLVPSRCQPAVPIASGPVTETTRRQQPSPAPGERSPTPSGGVVAPDAVAARFFRPLQMWPADGRLRWQSPSAQVDWDPTMPTPSSGVVSARRRRGVDGPSWCVPVAGWWPSLEQRQPSAHTLGARGHTSPSPRRRVVHRTQSRRAKGQGEGSVRTTKPAPSEYPHATALGKFAAPRQNPHVLPLGFGSTHPEGGSIGFG